MSYFSKKIKATDAQIMKDFDDLRWDDQEKIRNKVDEKSTNDSIKKKTSFLF
jgi:hypothetical protein